MTVRPSSCKHGWNEGHYNIWYDAQICLLLAALILEYLKALMLTHLSAQSPIYKQ